MDDLGYADPGLLVADSFEFLLPPESALVADYAAQHRWLTNTGGGYVGRWKHDLAPYLVEPMNALDQPDIYTVAVVGPGQSGKTAIAENWMLKAVGSDPGDMLWYMQTDETVEAYVKARINPMVDAHELLKKNQGLRPVDDSLHFKRFRNMRVEFLSATLRSLINKNAPRIVADEIDAYPPSVGDVKALLDVRRQTFGRRSTLLMLSHPDKARGLMPDRDWLDGIMGVYADSDRRVWYWPCPYCHAWSSPAPVAERVMAIDYPTDGTLDDVEKNTRLVCPVNGCAIEDQHRMAMNRQGRWVGAGQRMTEAGKIEGELIPHRTAGFWIVGAMSLFGIGGIGGLARARVKAEREAEISGDDGTARQVMVKQWGIPYAPKRGIGSIDAETLAERCEPLQLGAVPQGVRFLTVAVDVQLEHFEYLVRGWGVGGESWIIDRGKVGDTSPATNPHDWDLLLDRVLLRTYPLGDGTGRQMKIRGAGYDSGGLPGVTQQAYAAWTRWRRKKHVAKIGVISGRDVYSIIPMKGASSLNSPKLSVTYPDTGRKSNIVAASGHVPVAVFNPNLFKDDLGGQLLRAEDGPWCVHFPTALRSPESPHVFFEQLVSETRDYAGRWEKTSPTARNEALDLMVMTHGVAHLHGVSRIDWTRPPAWAAEWDTNPMVVMPPPPVTPAPERRALIKKIAG